MKTKEFVKKVKELGLGVYTHGRDLDIESGYYNYVVATIDIKEMYGLSISYNDYIALDEDTKKELYKLCIEYAATPVDEREEERKFYLRHKYFQDHIGGKQYFCIRVGGGYPLLKSFPTPHADKYEFTLKEIDEIKEKFDTNLSEFEMVDAKK